jgi:hypothetical protein
MPTSMPLNERFSRQTQLKFTATNELTLEKNRPVRGTQPYNAFILQLPDELLLQIFESMADSAPETWRNRLAANHVALPLTLVCDRFYRLSIPVLYGSFTSDSYPKEIVMVPPGSSIQALHRSLRENPALRGHCREFLYYRDWHNFSSYAQPCWRMVKDLVDWSPRVTDLHIYGGFQDMANWRLLERIAVRMPDIRILKYSREDFKGLCFSHIVDLPVLLELEEMSIHGISELQGVYICPKVIFLVVPGVV